MKLVAQSRGALKAFLVGGGTIVGQSLVVIALLGLVGCGGGGTPAKQDGAAADAPAGGDRQASGDSGPGGGSGADGGGRVDGGAVSDAGGRPDGGSSPDRGQSPEGGSSPDGGGDAGPPPVICQDTCHYVRQGGTGKGASWEDPFGALPATLIRGDTYFVSAGTYPGYTFDDPPGAMIRILRATAVDHGDAAGWKAEYGVGQAIFGPLAFKTGDYELDGRSLTVVRGAFQGNVVAISADRVTLRDAELDAGFQMSGGKHTAGACSGLEMSGNNLTVEGMDLHDAADDGVVISGRNIQFRSNQVYRLHGCGTDGGCGPCFNGHSDGIELYAVKDSILTGNFVHHVKSTAAVFFGNWADSLGGGPADYCTNVTFTNNVFYSPDTGFAVYFEDSNGIYFANNVVWGIRQGAYGGLAIGKRVKGLDMVNNVILSVNYAHLGSTFNAAEHRGDYNLFGASLGQWVNQPHDIVNVDPGFTGIPSASGMDVLGATAASFTPKPASPLKSKGTTGPRIPTVDLFGTPRGTPPTIGAIE